MLVMLGYLGLCLAYAVWVWSDEISDLIGDSAMYMLMARTLSPFYPHSDVLALAVHGTMYPPLFPIVIGLLGGSKLAAHLVPAFTLLAAIWCFYSWMRHEGLGRPVSAWLAAIFALMPGTYLLTLNIWTENPYLLLSFIAILALNCADDSAKPRPGLLWIAAVAVAVAALTRAAALPLLAAFIIHLLLRRPRHWLGLVLTRALPFVVWVAWSKLHQTGILCLVACLRRLLQLRFDAIYASVYMPLLLVWPFPAEATRLSYALIPVLLVETFSMVRALGTRQALIARMHPVSILGALTLAILPALLLTLHRFLEPLPQELAPSRLSRLGNRVQPISMISSDNGDHTTIFAALAEISSK